MITKIKAKDLRIGNTIDKGFILSVTPAYVMVQDTDYIDTPVKYKLYEIEPIAITEDKLIAYGFEKNDYKMDADDYYSLNEFRLYDNTNAGDNYSIELTAFHVKLKWIHQLENLYCDLTGKELKMKAN